MRRSPDAPLREDVTRDGRSRMTRLILLIGLPGSGKSTLARQLAAQWPGYQLISTDAIRARLFGDAAIQGEWLLVWRQIRQQFQKAVATAPAAIYDATNAKRCHRRQAIALARDTGFTHSTGIWLRTPLQHCLERNHHRDRQVPSAVILQMHGQLESAPPAVSDGLDSLIYYRGLPRECGNRDRPSAITELPSTKIFDSLNSELNL